MSADEHRCGVVAIVGRSNVGKSTLLNKLLGQKLSITSDKPQTTRHRILGVVTRPHAQVLFVDTPGMHTKHRGALHRYMNRAATGAMQGVDLVLFVVQGTQWNELDQDALERVSEAGRPVVAVINKIDLVDDKTRLLPWLETLERRHKFEAIIPISARKGENLGRLEDLVIQHLPVGPAMFPESQITDRDERFLVTEIVREKLLRHLGQEVPYGCTVGIENYVETESRTEIDAVIWVEHERHKGIVIGKGGAQLKAIGVAARRDLETMLGVSVTLHTWVKVKAGWTQDEGLLKEFGYADL